MRTLATKVLIALGAFVAGTAIALLLGADSLGVAATFGQIAFAATVVVLMLRD